MSNQLKGILYASVSSLLWGFLAIALKFATASIPAINIVWFRFLFAFMVLFLSFAIGKPSRLGILCKPPWLLLVAAAGLAFNYLGFTKGLEYVSPNTAQLIIQLGPILLGVAGVVFFKETLGKWQILGFVLAVLGLLTFYRVELGLMLNPASKTQFQIGFLWVLAGAIAWLFYAILQKILVRTYDAQSLNLVVFGLPVLLFAPVVDMPIMFDLNISQWLLLIFLGANTVIAYGSLTMAFKYADANKIAVVITLNPIITFILMAILHWQQVDWIKTNSLNYLSALGAAMVIVGAIMIALFKVKSKA